MELKEHIGRLHKQRNQAWEEAKALRDQAAKEERDFSAEEQQKWDRINSDIDGKDEEIRTLIDLEEREKEADEARAAYESLIPEPDLRSQAEQQEAEFRAWAAGEGSKALDVDLTVVAREKGLIRAGASGREFRDLISDTATAGGNTVPTSFVRSLYDFLEVYSGMRRVNVTVITTASGEALEFPKVTLHGTAAIVGEGTALAENDPQFGKMTLNSWKYGQLLQYSNELITDTGVDLLGFFARDCARAIARATDAHYLDGDGSSKPSGAVKGAGTAVTTQTTATGQPSYSDLVSCVYSINEEYRMNQPQWLVNDGLAESIRKIVDGNGRPLWEPSVQVGEPDMLLGYPVFTDPNFDAVGTAAGTPGAFGDWSTYYIRDVGNLRFERSDDFAFSSDMVTYRCILRTDGERIDDNGLKILKAPTT